MPRTFSLKGMEALKREELPALRRSLKELPARTRPRRRLEPGIGRIGVIAEIKKGSPSAGPIRAADPAAQARLYAAGGARALSVLTDGNFFSGSFEDLRHAAAACDLPVLCKEFVFFEEQIEAADLNGADMVLLIARTLSPERLAELYRFTLDRGLLPLVEVHGREELPPVLDLDPGFLLVNTRNLETLVLDRPLALETLKALTEGIEPVCASGIGTSGDIREIRSAAKVNLFLIGTSLMRAGDPQAMIKELCHVH